MISETDADFVSEVLGSKQPEIAPSVALIGANAEATALQFVPLKLSGNTFEKSRQSELLLHRIGGGGVIHGLIQSFYEKMFVDSHLDQFVRSHDDPHASRLANWIIEKMGGEGDLWTQERMERSRCPVSVQLPTRGDHIVHDRTTAHVAAWFSPKRSAKDVGEHFKLHDARTWMRLMFWSCREQGLFDDSVFESWFVRFIAHFVRVYERMGPYFARESARWSLNPQNIERYIADGNRMPDDVLGATGSGVPVQLAIKQVPAMEINESLWPYNKDE